MVGSGTSIRRVCPRLPGTVAEMRVVAGELGGRTLVAPDGQTTRPTTDKVREAVFNSLASMGVLEDAAVADLFAGSGALGIEALSRGAARCSFVERDRNALVALRANLAALDLGDRTSVVVDDALVWLAAARGFDLLLIDPPYRFEGWTALLDRARACGAWMAVCEAETEITATTHGPSWSARRSKRYGRTHVTILERVDDAS
jgi:16S rRNA (guanine966-N2)-methyltransferase